MYRKAWVISVWLHFQYCSVLLCQWHCGFRLVFGFLQPIKLTAAIQHGLHGVHHATNLHLVRGKSVKVNPTVIWLWQRKPLNINIQTINTPCYYVHCKGHVNKWKFGAFLIKKSWNFHPRIIRLQLGKGEISESTKELHADRHFDLVISEALWDNLFCEYVL